MWDTVAALPKDELSFVDEKIPKIVRLAVHALALNEQRTQYAPLLWREDEEPTSPTRLHQCWFLGSHSDIGGGNKYPDLANITFAWVISLLQDLVGFSEDAIYDITQNFQTELELESPKRLVHTKGDGHVELSFHLPVSEFQSKTDTHVNWLAWAQRGAGSGYRKPLSCGDRAQERVHWSVQRLLDKKIVSGCYPLELVQDRIRIDKPKQFERKILAIWIARQCQEALRFAFGHDKRSKWLSLSAGIIPTYVVLWPLPDDEGMDANGERVNDLWSVVTEDLYAPRVSINLCGEMVVKRMVETEIIQQTHKDITFWEEFTKIAGLGHWAGVSRSIPTLQGQITLNFSGGDWSPVTILRGS